MREDVEKPLPPGNGAGGLSLIGDINQAFLTLSAKGLKYTLDKASVKVRDGGGSVLSSEEEAG